MVTGGSGASPGWLAGASWVGAGVGVVDGDGVASGREAGACSSDAGGATEGT
jgi:hypothetical protein